MKPQLRSLLILILCIVLAVSGCTLWEREPQLEFSYTAKTTQCNPGDEISITVKVLNVGSTVIDDGPPIDWFDASKLITPDSDSGYSIISYKQIHTDAMSPFPFETGASVSWTYTFSIPEDAPCGAYDLHVSFAGTSHVFAEVIQITDSN